MAWQIEMTDTARKQLLRLDHRVQAEVVRYLRERIAAGEDPRRFGSPLRRDLTGLWKYRVMDYRVVCDIQDDKKVVLVVYASHRSKVYGGH